MVFVDGNIGYNKDLLGEEPTPATPPSVPAGVAPVSVALNANLVPTATSLNHNQYDSSTTSGQPNSQGGLSGLNYAAERTVSSNYQTNAYVRINGEITRGDTVNGQNPPTTTRRDGFGVVGYNVVIGQNLFGQTSNLYGLYLAGRRGVLPAPNGTGTNGSVIYENYDQHALQNLNIWGSYIVENDVNWGYLGGPGWNPNFNWDAALASSPPPFFPTQSDYKIQAYKEY